jgi:ABC-type nitrate/sulfonate/bicarbonate transport system substrate-binding protein
MLKALIKANRYIRANRDGSIQVLVEWARTTKEDASISYDAVVKVFNQDGSIPDDGLQSVIESAVKELKPSRYITSSDVSDLRMLREAQRELGIKAR